MEGWTMGVNHSTQGAETVNAICNLALLTGNLGRAGASPFSITGQCNAMGTREAGFASSIPGYRKFESAVDREEVAAIWGVDLDVSTLAGWVGAAAATLMPLVNEIGKHVLAAERLHADDTTVPVLGRGKCTTARLWTYVRDDGPFGGDAAPAALFYYSPDRAGKHPEKHLAAYTGLMQADAYSGYKGLYAEGRKPGPIFEAACWSHGRRKFCERGSTTRWRGRKFVFRFI